MKFFSKISNLSITLRPGIPGDMMLGRPATQGLYLRFQHGVVDVSNPEVVQLALQSPRYKIDFHQFEDETVADPLAAYRKPEAEHDIWEIQHGSVTKSLNPRNTKLPPELQRLIAEEASRLAKEKFLELIEGARAESRMHETKAVDEKDVSEPAVEENDVTPAEDFMYNTGEEKAEEVMDSVPTPISDLSLDKPKKVAGRPKAPTKQE